MSLPDEIICDDIVAACNEVRRQLEHGSKVVVERFTASPATFLVTVQEDKVEVTDHKHGGRKLARVIGYPRII